MRNQKVLDRALKFVKAHKEVRSPMLVRLFGFKGENARERARKILRALVKARKVRELRDHERKGAFVWRLA